ncbi:MAG TPA: hypothetical protein PLC42_00910 [Parachlamydiaceae bacterium]|nr:hypothetical protein [Parachlamydiaceae bacterium]
MASSSNFYCIPSSDYPNTPTLDKLKHVEINDSVSDKGSYTCKVKLVDPTIHTADCIINKYSLLILLKGLDPEKLINNSLCDTHKYSNLPVDKKVTDIMIRDLIYKSNNVKDESPTASNS